MSADHKRPLFAFVVLALLCALFVAHAVSSDSATSSPRPSHSQTP